MDAGLFTNGRMINEPYPGAYQRINEFYNPRPRRRPGDYVKAAGQYAAGLAMSAGRRYLYGPKRPYNGPQGGPRPYKRRRYTGSGRIAKAMHRAHGSDYSIPQGNGRSTVLYPTGKLYLSKGLLQTLQPSHWVINAGQQITCAQAVQAITSFPVATCADLAVMATDVKVGTTSIAVSFLLEKVKQTISFTNSSTYQGIFTLYDCELRRDVYTGTNPVTPQAAWINGIVDELAAGAATNVGNKPYMSDLFNQFYKVIKTTNVELQPGANHVHTTIHKVNKKIHNEVVANVTTGMAGVTTFTMMVLASGPAHDSTTKTFVSLPGIGIDCVNTIAYDYKQLLNNTTFYKKTNNLTTFAVGPEVINEELGELQNAAGITAGGGIF